ncbi:MAG TPA: hypothetical protein VIY49_06125 [Bryobacteraceae bacterium]
MLPARVLFLSAVLIATWASACFAQQTGRVLGGQEPPQPVRGEVRAIADPALIRSFGELCKRVDLIVEGTVETDAGRMMPGRGLPIETDFWIKVDRVLKGSVDTDKIVVSEAGGAVGDLHLIMNFPLLQRGQRYVLLLYTDKRPGIPPVPDLPRYQAEIFYGTFAVDAGYIHPVFVNSFEGKYIGMTVEAFAAEIAAELKR